MAQVGNNNLAVQTAQSTLVTNLRRASLSEDEISHAQDFLALALKRQDTATLSVAKVDAIANAVQDIALKRIFQAGVPQKVIINIHNPVPASKTPLIEDIGKAFVVGAAGVLGANLAYRFPYFAAPFMIGCYFTKGNNCGEKVINFSKEIVIVSYKTSTNFLSLVKQGSLKVYEGM